MIYKLSINSYCMIVTSFHSWISMFNVSCGDLLVVFSPRPKIIFKASCEVSKNYPYLRQWKISNNFVTIVFVINIISFSSCNMNPKTDVSKIVSLMGFYRAVGGVSWFPVHCTSINNTNKFISGDNKGVAAQYLEKWGQKEGKEIITAFAQANVGDTSPNTKGAFCQDTGLVFWNSLFISWFRISLKFYLKCPSLSHLLSPWLSAVQNFCNVKLNTIWDTFIVSRNVVDREW